MDLAQALIALTGAQKGEIVPEDDEIMEQLLLGLSELVQRKKYLVEIYEKRVVTYELEASSAEEAKELLMDADWEEADLEKLEISSEPQEWEHLSTYRSD